MDNSFPQQGSRTQQPGSLLPGLRFFVGVLSWLVGLIQLTEEERKEAGVYVGDPLNE